MTENEFLALIGSMENQTLDFKRTAYDLTTEPGKINFIKDILCMANTPRTQDSHIILGVKKHADGTFDLCGLDKHVDEAELQSQLVGRVNPIPVFSYEVFSYDGKVFGILKIPPIKKLSVPTKDFGNVIRQNQVYFRRGSKNDIATPDDILRISKWVDSTGEQTPSYLESTPEWEMFLQSVYEFDNSRRYILISGLYPEAGNDNISSIGLIPWSAVFDFDPNSDLSGLLKSTRDTIEQLRSLHLVVIKERPSLNPDRATYWFFCRGLEGRRDTIEIGAWKEWVKRYSKEINEQFRRLTASLSPAPITCIVLWYQPELILHLRSTLESALSAFGDSIEFVVVTDSPADVQSIASQYDVHMIPIPLNHLCSGMNVYLSKQIIEQGDEYLLPSSSGAPIIIEKPVQKWLDEELEIVHLNVDTIPIDTENSHIGRAFLKGAEITWIELSLNFDVEREITHKVKRLVEAELRNKRTVRINLYHAPGAGGTTVARRIIWDFHKIFPCAILQRCTPIETAERLYKLASLTGQAILLLIDSSKVSEREIDELSDLLKSRQIPVVLLQTLRRFTHQRERERTFYLKAELTSPESSRFLEKFSHEVPEKRKDLQMLASSNDIRKRTAFYFGLQTFGKDFLGLEPYVAIRINELTSIQKKIIGFIALSHHYGQRPLRAQAFAYLLGIPKNRTIRFSGIFKEATLDLLIEDEIGIWRTAHDLIAVEIMEQLLLPSLSDRRIWRQNLSSWSIDFAHFCTLGDSIQSEEMLEVARRVFIYRDNIDILGTEKSANRTFSQLIQDIPSNEGKFRVLKELVELYPEEAHFWAHLGRYYAIIAKDYEAAHECIERAIANQQDDHVLHHMKGMVLRYKIYSLIENNVELNEVIDTAIQSSQAFESARNINPDDEHAFISEVQMLARVLDYAGRPYAGGILEYLSLPNANPFLVGAFGRAEELLEQVRRNREGEGTSPYEEGCRANIDSLYGRYESALQIWDNILTNQKSTYFPPIRRQIVWTYLARHKRRWDDLNSNEVERIVSLLEDNLQEEPNNDKNLRLWVQAVRRSKNPPSIDSIIERVGYWKANSESLDSIYYLYVFHALLALKGSELHKEEALRYMDECRQKARYRRNRTISLEWVGKGQSVDMLIHHSELGQWGEGKDFWENTDRLKRVKGRIARIDAPQNGLIEVEGGLMAFFVPARGNYNRGQSENKLVDFYLGFSYDGLRAWEVKDANGKSK